MNISLYQAQIEKQNIIMLCADEDGVIDIDAVNRIECTFQERAVATVAVIKTLTHKADALAAQMAAVMREYEQAINAIENNAARLKGNLLVAMKATGTSQIKSDDSLLAAKFYPDRDVSVELDDGAEFPPSLCNKPKPPTPSKALIKAAILAGEAVAHARLVRSDRLEIK